MRPEEEIRAVIEDINFTLALPGDGGFKEAVMRVNLEVLKWALGEDNVSCEVFAGLKEAVAKAKAILAKEYAATKAAKERRN